MSMRESAIARVLCSIRGNLRLPAITNRKQHLFRCYRLFTPLHVELLFTSQHDGVRRACLLAETAIDALEEIDIVACRPAAAVGPLDRLDGNRQWRTYRFT